MENEIKNALSQFETLLRQQLQRQECMEQNAEAKDFTKIGTITIGLMTVTASDPSS